MGLKSLLLAIGLALAGGSPLERTPDGLILLRPRRGPDGESLPDDDLIRYMTPVQRAARGWCVAPFLLIPPLLIFFFTVTGVHPGVRTKIQWDNPAHVTLFCCFFLILALCFLGAFTALRISSAVDCQIYDPQGD
jgi:hypothetical protein